MAQEDKLDSNVTELRWSEETSYKVANASAVWNPAEPNSYTDWGADNVLVARNPINSSAQRKKGVIVDVNAAGGYENDITQTNMQDMMQGFMFADLRVKTEFGGSSEITNVDGTSEDYDAASGLDAFDVGDLVFASGFTNAANNGLKRVTAASATALTVAEDLVDETPPAAAKLVKVGFQFAAGDLDVDTSGTLPALTTSAKDLTELGLIPGEPFWIGGDLAALGFANAENNGKKTPLSISANSMTIYKSQSNMVTEASTTETVQIFFGRVLKNELGSLITRRSYQFERQLGAPDNALPAEIQAQYLIGGIANTFELQVTNAEIVKAQLGFIFADQTTIDGPTALKTGTRPALVEADAFNSTSDFSQIRMAAVDMTDEAPTPLFAYITDLTLTINNNARALKAIGVRGGFEVSRGTFEVGGSLTAYFNNVSQIDAVGDNQDVTLDFLMVRENAGIAFDVPLIATGDGRPNVEQDDAITIPLNIEAATGAKVDSALDHTLLLVWFDYLPDAADV